MTISIFEQNYFYMSRFCLRHAIQCQSDVAAKTCGKAQCIFGLISSTGAKLEITAQVRIRTSEVGDGWNGPGGEHLHGHNVFKRYAHRMAREPLGVQDEQVREGRPEYFAQRVNLRIEKGKIV